MNLNVTFYWMILSIQLDEGRERMKKIQVLAIVLTIQLLTVSCGNPTVEPSKSSSSTEASELEHQVSTSKDLSQQLESPPSIKIHYAEKAYFPAMGTYSWTKDFGDVSIDPEAHKFGIYTTKLTDFKLIPEVSGDYPKQFRENGKVGFKDNTGKIIVEAIYDYANDFYNGIASARGNLPDDKYKWSYINSKGVILDYEQVNGFFYGVSLVQKDNKYGFINYNNQLLTPVIFDEAYLNYIDEKACAYVKLDNRYLYLDLYGGYVYEYERYDEKRSDEYVKVIDLDNEDIVIVNNRILIDGITDDVGKNFPMYVLNQLKFQIIQEDKSVKTEIGTLGQGAYEGELNMFFPSVQGDYFATIATTPSESDDCVSITDTSKFETIIKDFLDENAISQTPFFITRAQKADFLGNGTSSIIIEAMDIYQEGWDTIPFKEKWSEEQFKEKEIGFFHVILILEDESMLMDYRVINAGIFQRTDALSVPSQQIVYIANLDQDPESEVIVLDNDYDYQNYSVLQISK